LRLHLIKPFLAGILLSLSGLTVFAQGLAAAADQSQLGPWQIDEYRSPQWTQKDNVVTLTAAKSAGLYFRISSDIATRYQLIVKGQPLSGMANLRIKLDDGAPQYFSAPNGQFELSVDGTHDIEALIYADQPFSYRLDEIALKPCPTRPTASERAASASSFAPAANVRLYGDPEVARRDEPGNSFLSIHHGASGPAGIYFEYVLSPDRSYRLTINGNTVSGTNSLRLDTDNDEPGLFSVLPGTMSLVITAKTKLQVLLYSDSPFEYWLGNITVAEDPDAPTKKKLKQIIFQQRPKLKALLAGGQTLPAIEELLHWTSGVVSLGERDDVSDRNTMEVVIEPVEQSYEDVWQSDAGGARCAAFAVFFAKILNLFGIDALTIDVGYPGTLVTHVTTIVPIASDGGFRLYVFDPTLTGVFKATGTGAYVDLAQVLEWDAAGSHAYRFDTLTVARKAFVPSWKEAAFAKSLRAAHENANCVSGTADHPTRTVCGDFHYDLAFLMSDWRPRLRNLGLLSSARRDLMTTLLKTPVNSITDFAASEKSINLQHVQLTELLARFRFLPLPNAK
jgi:hypothetical protein